MEKYYVREFFGIFSRKILVANNDIYIAECSDQKRCRLSYLRAVAKQNLDCRRGEHRVRACYLRLIVTENISVIVNRLNREEGYIGSHILPERDDLVTDERIIVIYVYRTAR